MRGWETRYKPELLQFEKDGKRIQYDACSSSSLEEAEKFYGKGFEYIGSSHIIYVNGVRNDFEELYHFFERVV